MKNKILAMTLALMMIGSLSACGSSDEDKTSKTSSQTKSEQKSEETESSETETSEPAEPTVDQTLETYFYNVTMAVPAEEAADGSLEPKFVPIEYDEGEVSIVDGGFANDTVAIEFSYISYTFNTNIYYKEKYGEMEANFENYVEYMKDEDFSDPFTTGIEETTVGDYEALKYIYNGKVIYVLNVDGLTAKFMVFVRPLDDNADPEGLVDDPEINSILNSIKVEVNDN